MKSLLLAVTLLVGFSQAVHSSTVEQRVISSLKAQGYQVLEQSYTFLGRLRILAVNGDLQREIVVNPGTGEIVTDTAVSLRHPDADETIVPQLTIDIVLPDVVSPVEPDVSDADVLTESSVEDVPSADVDDVVAPDAKETANGHVSSEMATGSDYLEFGTDQPDADLSQDLSAP